ncbi:MAG: HNH endonuclease [Clostridia bacterium]|nr:HNH endonuclease [Clostridia bacterium]
MRTYKLDFEFVPEECWGYSLYHKLTRADWDKVRKDAYRRAGYKCRVCGAKGVLEAHEKWRYDDEKALQKLEDVLALCHACHEVKHISLTYQRGRGMDAMEHFMKVNGCSQMEYHEALEKANEKYFERNKVEGWTTDVSWLKDKFDITLK